LENFFHKPAKAGFDFKPGVLIGLAMVAIDSTIVGLLAISAMKINDHAVSLQFIDYIVPG